MWHESVLGEEWFASRAHVVADGAVDDLRAHARLESMSITSASRFEPVLHTRPVLKRGCASFGFVDPLKDVLLAPRDRSIGVIRPRLWMSSCASRARSWAARARASSKIPDGL